MWICPDCGSKLDRDVNAAINIKRFALLKQNTGQELPSEPVEIESDIIDASISEAGSLWFQPLVVHQASRRVYF